MSKTMSNIQHPRRQIKGLAQVGSIWQQNEKQRKQSKKLHKLGRRTISSFKNSLTRLNKKCDAELLSIKRKLKADFEDPWMRAEIHERNAQDDADAEDNKTSSDSANPFGTYDEKPAYQDPQGRVVGRAGYPGMEKFDQTDDALAVLRV